MFNDNQSRRRLLETAATAAMTIAATPSAFFSLRTGRGEFGPVKQIDAGVLNIGYVEAGEGKKPVVILLHGWPYDIHSYADVTPLLAAKGYRVIVPYLRGYGTTRFRSTETIRNAQQAAFAVDIIELMDVLKIEKAIIAGFDWGARTA